MLGILKNLIRPLAAWFEDGYCSITVVNHQLIIAIRFVAQSYTHPWKGFANKLHLILHAWKILRVARIAQMNSKIMPQEERNNKMLLPLEPMIGSLGISPESVHKGYVEILTVTPSRKKMMPTTVQQHHHRHKLDFQTRTCTPRNQEAIHGRVTILRTMIAWWRRPGGISGRVLVFMIYISSTDR